MKRAADAAIDDRAAAEQRAEVGTDSVEDAGIAGRIAEADELATEVARRQGPIAAQLRGKRDAEPTARPSTNAAGVVHVPHRHRGDYAIRAATVYGFDRFSIVAERVRVALTGRSYLFRQR